MDNQYIPEKSDVSAEAETLSYLAEWINIQGDEGEVNEMMDRASARIPQKVQDVAEHVENGCTEEL